MSEGYPLPFVSWVGGKRRHVERVIRMVGDLNPKRIVSPFLGGGALELALAARFPDAELVLSDANPRLIKAWEGVLQDAQMVAGYLEAFERWTTHDHMKEWINEVNPDDEEAPIYAARFIWLVTRSFSALYRENRKGERSSLG